MANTIAPRDPNAPTARPAIKADGSHIRKARLKKPHLNNKNKHSRTIEHHNLAKHSLQKGQ